MQLVKSWHLYRLLAASALLLSLAGRLAAADPVMYSPDSVEPGGVLQVMVSGDPLENLTLSLEDGRDRTISRAEGFRWNTPTGRSVSVALLGIPSSASPGHYSLVLSADQGRAVWRQEKTLVLTDRMFPEQVITMSDKMGSLYSDDSERKKSESRALWSVLTSFDPAARYHIGPFRLPLDEGVPTADFGDRRRYRMPDGSETASVHYGSDLWAEKGTVVRVAGKGRVVMAANRFLTGNTVVVEHLPGVFTMYYHMDTLVVMDGQMVDEGDRIGTVGETGFATGEHLHWEMRVGATPVDPKQFLQKPLLDTNTIMSKM